MKLDKTPDVTNQSPADRTVNIPNPVETNISNKTPAEPDDPKTQDDGTDKQEPVVTNEETTKERVPQSNLKQRRASKTKSLDDEDLGIYEDTDDGDDLTDTELELERLREEKRKRDEEERKERERKAAVGADGRHAARPPDNNEDVKKVDEVNKDGTFLTGGGMEMEEEKDKIDKVQEYLDKNVLNDPLHAQGVKRKAGFSQSAFSRTDHVTNMTKQLTESM